MNKNKNYNKDNSFKFNFLSKNNNYVITHSKVEVHCEWFLALPNDMLSPQTSTVGPTPVPHEFQQGLPPEASFMIIPEY